MAAEARLPVLDTTLQAWRLAWRHRRLHAKAIWPPVLFLVLAEFIYHRVVGDSRGVLAHYAALASAPWYVLAGAAAAWLLGVKFLLSFSISWRRHLQHHERFDPFFFAAPFWRYLAFLVLTYLWLIVLLLAAFALGALGAGRLHIPGRYALIPPVLAILFSIWAIIRQVPSFNALALGPPHLGWRTAIRAMRGQSLRYLAAWILAMLPIVLLNLGLDTGLKALHADPHRIPVALGESCFRQAMLFLHFSFGASIGLITWRLAVLNTEPGALPLHPAKGPSSL